MDSEIKDILENVKSGGLSIDEAYLRLKEAPFDDIGYAKVDLHRKIRQGAGEVIYGAGKTPEQICGICDAMLRHGQSRILITRLDKQKSAVLEEHLRTSGMPALRKSVTPDDGITFSTANLYSNTAAENTSDSDSMPQMDKGAAYGDKGSGLSDTAGAPYAKSSAASGVSGAAAGCTPYTYNSDARIGIIGKMPVPDGIGRIIVATGGTSDIPVAEEAALTAEFNGNEVVRLYDVGVSGLHRLLSHMDEIMSASVIIAVAGMEGALASVIGGLADCPVIAVPTSVGYGASFGGLSALLSMLNSCASGVSVVNIDNGFGAGFTASRINHPKIK